MKQYTRTVNAPTMRVSMQPIVLEHSARLRYDTCMDYLLIGIGGFLGANARYIIAGWVGRTLGLNFPYGTFLINVSGSFFLGLLMGLLYHRPFDFLYHRLFFAVGFLGAYTTFSTFSYETLRLAQDGHLAAVLLYSVGSVLLGIVAVFLGFVCGEFLSP
jgi:CrcB protein